MNNDEREFQVFVKPVGSRCNLRCSYCYYLGHGHQPAARSGTVMSDELLREYIRQHLAASGGDEIFFSWHGGEPMLAGLPFYRRVTTLQRELAPEGCPVVNGIQTNGTLVDEEWARFFHDENFYCGISLDGPERFHNKFRISGNGKGTYSEVMRAIELLQRHNVTCEVLCVVNNENVQAPLELYGFFRGLGVSYITFIPLVEPVTGVPAPVTGRSVRAADWGRFLCAIFDEWLENDIGKIKVQIFEEALRSAFGQGHTLCIFRPECGAVPVVDINGDFYACDHYVTGEYMFGNIMERELSTLLDDPRQKSFGAAKRLLLPGYCRRCEVLGMCNGECPKNRIISTPDGEPGLNWLCEGYRRFFNHVLPFVSEVAKVWQAEQQQRGRTSL